MALKQPPFRPPPQAFGPVWTILYGLMGYAAHRAYSTGMHPLSSTEQHLLTKQGATLYTIQLGYVHSRNHLRGSRGQGSCVHISCDVLTMKY